MLQIDTRAGARESRTISALAATPQGLQDDLANTNRICAGAWAACKLRARDYRDAARRERNAVTESDRRYFRNRRHNLAADFEYAASVLKIYRDHRRAILAALADWHRSAAA